jgi:DNA polymerase
MAELDALVESELADYCKHDVYLCERIFDRLVKGYPAKELRLIDMTMKMYTNPMLELDEDMLFNALHEEREAREELLERLQISDADLASNDRFAELLRKVGMEPPTKKKKPTVKTPEVGCSKLAMMLSKVDLPHPEGPKSATNSPG